MNGEEQTEIQCPYCGERNTVFIDCSESEQEYIEDCQVCCRPIRFNVCITENEEVQVSVFHENE